MREAPVPDTRESAKGGRHRRGLWIAIVVIALAPLLAYPSMVLRGYEPAAPDTQAGRPFGIWGTETEHRTGQVPAWYPYIFSGMPSYGSFTYTPRSPLDPLAAIQKLVQGRRGAYYYFLFVAAGLGTFVFLRRRGCSRLSSATASLIYSLTPYFPGSIAAGHSTKIEALCLLPWLLLAIDLFLDRPDALRAAFLGYVGALLAWSNHPQVAFYGLFIGTVYGVGSIIAERRDRRGRRWWFAFAGLLVAAAFLAGAMAMEPYLAVREYAPYSIRGGVGGAEAPAAGSGGVGWEYATAWSFHPKELISFLFPAWYGLEGETYWGAMPFTQSTHYFGILALGLALVGLFALPGRRRWVWGILCGAVLLIGFGRYLPVLYGPMYYVLPLFNKFRVPSMIYSTLPLCAAPLIAGGLDALADRAAVWRQAGARAQRPAREGKGAGKPRGPADAVRASRRIAYAIAGVVVVGGLIALAARAGSSGSALLRPEEAGQASEATLSALQAARLSLLLQSVARGCLLVIAALLVLLLAATGLGARRRWVGVALAVLAVADVWQLGHHFYQVAPPVAARDAAPLPGAAGFLSQQPGPFRILPAEGTIFQSNAFGLSRLESVGGYHPAKLRAYQDLLGANLITHPSVLQMLNVRYILSPSRLNLGVEPLFSGDGYVYPYPDSLPRAWAVPAAELIADKPAMLHRLSDDSFHPRDTALLYSSLPHPSGVKFAAAKVSVLEHASGLLRLRVEAEGAALVVMSEMAYPPGWKATVNGAPAAIYRVDHVLQGITVPAGTSEVSLRASSPGMVEGRRISRAAGAITLLLAVGGWAWARRRPQAP